LSWGIFRILRDSSQKSMIIVAKLLFNNKMEALFVVAGALYTARSLYIQGPNFFLHYSYLYSALA